MMTCRLFCLDVGFPLGRRILVFFLVLLVCNGAWAQSVLQTAIEQDGPSAPEKRAELYRELERDAAILEVQSRVVKNVAKLIRPTVVHIEAADRRQTSRSHSQHHTEEAGSGVIIQLSEKYYVLTNRHVIRGASLDGIKISLADGRTIHPTRTWHHDETDVGVMAIEAPNLVAARIGDSDKLEVGDFVLAVGSPFGLSRSVTFGIISAKSRHDLEMGDTLVSLQDFIQTDASINPGNSGGPLVNLRAEIVGINTAIASNSGGNEGIGFAIPVNMFVFFAQQLIEKGEVSRAFLGVNLDVEFGTAMAIELGLPHLMGARVSRITPGAPADTADLKIGDVILQFNNVPVRDDTHLINLVSLTEIGVKTPLVIYRDRQEITLEVEVGDRSRYQLNR